MNLHITDTNQIGIFFNFFSQVCCDKNWTYTIIIHLDDRFAVFLHHLDTVFLIGHFTLVCT